MPSPKYYHYFINKTVGEDFINSLAKTELWKPATRSVSDLEDIHLGLKLVPRIIMSFLISELSTMNIGDHKDIDLPISETSKLRIDKHGPDVYSGDIEEKNKKITEFKFRSIPGVGLVVMSAFELYDIEQLDKKPNKHISDGMESKVQVLIDERMSLHAMVNHAIDKKLLEQDMVQQLINAKIKEPKIEPKSVPIQAIIENIEPSKIAKAQNDTKTEKIKGSPLKKFLNDRAAKLKKNEYQVKMVKGEQISCPDCGHGIFDGQVFSGCVCLGDDMDKKLYIKKTESGIKVRFGKGWDPENIEMLLEVLRRKRG